MRKTLLLFIALNAAMAEAGGGAGPGMVLRSTPREILAANANGQLRWRRAFPGLRVVSTGQVGQDVLVLAEQGDVQYGTQHLRIMLLSGVTGQTQWQRTVQGRLDGSGSGPLPQERGWGVIDGTFWVSRSTGGELWSNDNLGFRVPNGRPVWEMTGTGAPRAAALGEVLFRARTTAGMPNDPVNVKLLVVNSTTGATRTLALKIAQRPGCGPLDDVLVEENFLEVSSARFFDAQRHDQCGYFVTRFDWHGSERPHSVIRVPETPAQGLRSQRGGEPIPEGKR
ncbi:PQQ-like beta-propeller repeat protein [Deinococcus sp. QL22]|uniref:PQQ-like beta-propeller repeat protein n=1 Tax=Deinococcus sp. QL22 TaxID=2939437 RepID=UPI0020178179|nr:PQQ-like beta-propeller repeat protein [Deinococcus sp. QL22]UQN06556.1 PQQ-like beta-propeller repeat protein [Deinococcus sp. QL22]